MVDKKLTVGEIIEQLRQYPEYYRVVFIATKRAFPKYANHTQIIQTVRKIQSGAQTISVASEPVVEIGFKSE